MYVTIGYIVSIVNLICILWQYFVSGKYLKFFTLFLADSHPDLAVFLSVFGSLTQFIAISNLVSVCAVFYTHFCDQ